jgi:hypothetical protein
MIWDHVDRLSLQLDRDMGLRTKRVLRAEAVEQFPCPRCKRSPGHPCQTWWGWLKESPHKERVVCAALVNGGTRGVGYAYH